MPKREYSVAARGRSDKVEYDPELEEKFREELEKLGEDTVRALISTEENHVASDAPFTHVSYGDKVPAICFVAEWLSEQASHRRKRDNWTLIYSGVAAIASVLGLLFGYLGGRSH